MKRSTERILITHVGSLARPPDLMEMLVARNESKPYDRDGLENRLRGAVAEVVDKQIRCGIDIVNDGELGKSNFSRYTRKRLSGFVDRAAGPDFKPTSIFGRDMVEFQITSTAADALRSATTAASFTASNRLSTSATSRCKAISPI